VLRVFAFGYFVACPFVSSIHLVVYVGVGLSCMLFLWFSEQVVSPAALGLMGPVCCGF